MLPSKQDVWSMYNKVSSRVKQYALSLTPLELQVDEATNNEPWGPHGTVMAELARASFDYENYKQIMGVIARRLQSEGENWRHVYKSLLLLEYLTKHGPLKVADELHSNLGVIERLQRFEYKDKNSKDWGLNVRQRAKELGSLVSDPDRVKRERAKAKSNESKYTGVSADDSRMGMGFGSSSAGFGSTSSAFGGSALGSAGGGAKGFGSASGFGSDSAYGSGSRYDDDMDHAALNTEDPDDFSADAKEATRKRIDSLRKTPASENSEGRSSPLRSSRGTAAAAEQESSRGPKRLSQVRVNPNIALSLGTTSRGPSPLPAAAQPKAAAASSAPVIDLFGDESGPAAATAPASGAAGQDASWDAFSGSTAVAEAPQPPKDEWADLLESGSTPAPAPAQAPADPFAALASPQPQPSGIDALSPSVSATRESPASDPFGTFTTPQQRASGPLPLAPTPRRADADPFATLSDGDPFAPKPQSPLKSSLGRTTPRSTDAFASDPFGSLQQRNDTMTSTARTGGSGSLSRLGQALPEDMFSAPLAAAPRTRVQVGTHLQASSSGGSPSFGAAYQTSPRKGGATGYPAAAAANAASFGNFSGAQTPAAGLEDKFGSFAVSSGPTRPAAEDALGGGLKMAPNAPQPNLPPPVVKRDPFAGLAGF